MDGVDLGILGELWPGIYQVLKIPETLVDFDNHEQCDKRNREVKQRKDQLHFNAEEDASEEEETFDLNNYKTNLSQEAFTSYQLINDHVQNNIPPVLNHYT